MSPAPGGALMPTLTPSLRSQLLFASNPVRDKNTFSITSVEGFFIHVTYRIEHSDMPPIDEFYLALETDPEVGKHLLSWASINNEIYAALIHDLPYVVLPLIILVSYVSFV